MCLIIAPGKDGTPALLDRDVFDYAYNRNRDGFGAMWVEDGRVNHFKTLGLSADETYDKMKEYADKFPSSIFHLRMKTHGDIIPGLSHPFRILNKKRHGKDLFFMHNGVLGGFGSHLSYGQSDTTRFKDKVLIPLLTRDPDALDDPEIWEMINKTTSGSRLVFLDSDGNTKFTSESAWNERYGLMISNTYMLPTEHKYTVTVKDKRPAVVAGVENLMVTGRHCFFRRIDRMGVVNGCWCSCPKIGYVRTEGGMLYKDNGVNEKIYHATNYIRKEEEFKHLGLALVVTEPFRDYGFLDDDTDDVPWDDVSPSPSVDRSEAKVPAPEEQRLRYGRLLNNTYGGKITSRVHLMADLIGMNDKELDSLVDEDAETSSTILAELIEMVIEYNQALWAENPNNPKILDADEILRIGQADYHRDAIKEVTQIRRAEYEEQIKKINEVLDTPDEEVNVA